MLHNFLSSLSGNESLNNGKIVKAVGWDDEVVASI